MERLSLLAEFWYFIRHRRLWWMLPVVVSLLAIGVLIVAAAGSGTLAPFIYTLF